MKKLSRKIKLSCDAKIVLATVASGVVGGAITSGIALANMGATDLSLATATTAALLSSAIALNVATTVKKACDQDMVK